jgi:translation initiation factor 3 subunit B
VRKNLREYSREFEEADLAKKNTANRQVVEHRRRLLEEWLAWRASVAEELEAEGYKLDQLTRPSADETGGEVVEEWVEEIIDEQEEVA